MYDEKTVHSFNIVIKLVIRFMAVFTIMVLFLKPDTIKDDVPFMIFMLVLSAVFYIWSTYRIEVYSDEIIVKVLNFTFASIPYENILYSRIQPLPNLCIIEAKVLYYKNRNSKLRTCFLFGLMNQDLIISTIKKNNSDFKEIFVY